MGFFAENATVSSGLGKEVAPDGVYTCNLKEIIKGFRPKFGKPEEQEPKFDWIFEATEEVNSEGDPYRFRTTTNTSFGNDAAGLTKLFDKMFGRRLTSDEFQSLDLDDLKSRPWRVTIEEATTKNGNPCNNVTAVRGVKPAKAASAPAQRPTPKAVARPAVDEDEDPFED